MTYKNILLNNFSHEAVGGQKTTSENLNFKQLTKGYGYKNYFKLYMIILLVLIF